MKTIIHQSFGHVLGLDAVLLCRAQIENALVGNVAIARPEQDREVRLKPLGKVISVEYGQHCPALKPLGTGIANVAPTDLQYPCTAVGGGGHCR